MVAVILWGAYVRASGAGAGCGSHWPTCNGEILPRAKSIETIIEWTHRASTAVVSVLSVAQLIWAFVAFPRGHLVRRTTVLSMVFLLAEALIGAKLVRSELVTTNASPERALWVSIHLINTFLLLGSLTLTTFWADAPSSSFKLRWSRGVTSAVVAGIVGIMLVGATGAVTALGDTLFPARSVADGLTSDLASTHLLVRLRVLHPMAAAAVAAYLFVTTALVGSREVDADVQAPTRRGLRRLAKTASWIVALQLTAGFVNFWLLAPVWMQIAHLLLADLLFIALVRLAAASLRLGDEPLSTVALPQSAPSA